MAGLAQIRVTVNGEARTLEVEPRRLLVHCVRDDLGLTGTHIGCETGQCGACAVIVDGRAVKSCNLLAMQADGCDVRTIESFAHDGRVDDLQEAFCERHAVQCGFCTPGMIVATCALLQHNEHPDGAEIRRALAGNLCRCTGYQHIVDAVQRAAARRAGARP